MHPPVALTRPWPEDADDIAAALADWDVVRWLTTLPWPYGTADARDFIAAAGLDEHAIRQDGRLVGMVQAGRVFGIWIAPDRQGQGIGRRAGVLALSRLFLSGATEVHAHCLIGNDRSARLLAWLGFRPCGRTVLRSRPLRAEVPAEMLHLDRDTFQQRHAIALTTPRLRIDAVNPDDLPALEQAVRAHAAGGTALGGELAQRRHLAGTHVRPGQRAHPRPGLEDASGVPGQRTPAFSLPAVDHPPGVCPRTSPLAGRP